MFLMYKQHPSKVALKGKSHQLGSNLCPWITAKLPNILAFVSHVCSISLYVHYTCALYMHLSVMPVCQRCHFQMLNVCQWLFWNLVTTMGIKFQLALLWPNFLHVTRLEKVKLLRHKVYQSHIIQCQGIYYRKSFLIHGMSVSTLKRLLLDLVPHLELGWIRAL